MKPSDHQAKSIMPIAFRDTALTVALLRQGASSITFDIFRGCCLKHIRHLREELSAWQLSEDVINDAVYAQCALFDEAALNGLSGHDRDCWEREPLQVAEFSTHHAGEELIERMHRRLAEPDPVRPLLAIFLATLGLGFTGRFARDQQAARSELMRALRERLGMPEGEVDSIIVQSGRRRLRLTHVSLPIMMLLSAVGVVALYMLLDHWLAGLTAQIVQ